MPFVCSFGWLWNARHRIYGEVGLFSMADWFWIAPRNLNKVTDKRHTKSTLAKHMKLLLICINCVHFWDNTCLFKVKLIRLCMPFVCSFGWLWNARHQIYGEVGLFSMADWFWIAPRNLNKVTDKRHTKSTLAKHMKLLLICINCVHFWDNTCLFKVKKCRVLFWQSKHLVVFGSLADKRSRNAQCILLA